MKNPGIVLLSFGEPEEVNEEEVLDFLERIFHANRALEPDADPGRAKRLARLRAPGLVDVYQAIGGSPMNRQARDHGQNLARALGEQGHEVRVYNATQFSRPTIREVLERCRGDGIDTLVLLPLYPICGPTTTLAALASVRSELLELGWSVDAHYIGGWHSHPGYVSLRADGIRSFATATDLDLEDPGTTLYFSAHGTPVSYLRAGSQYQRYVEESCTLIAAGLGIDNFRLGYQNHSNRGVAWTAPSNEALIPELETERVLVVPVSFIHEQSETLYELDVELRALAAASIPAFHRAPTPCDRPELGGILAELVADRLGYPGSSELAYCRCQDAPAGVCVSGSPANRHDHAGAWT